jgi:hypothetical protein
LSPRASSVACPRVAAGRSRPCRRPTRHIALACELLPAPRMFASPSPPPPRPTPPDRCRFESPIVTRSLKLAMAPSFWSESRLPALLVRSKRSAFVKIPSLTPL